MSTQSTHLLHRRVRPTRPDTYYAWRLRLQRLATRNAAVIGALRQLRDALLGLPETH